MVTLKVFNVNPACRTEASFGLPSFDPLEAYGEVIQLSDLIRNIFICISKINESLAGLEQHEGE